MSYREQQLKDAFSNGVYVHVEFKVGWSSRKKLSKEYCEAKGFDSKIEGGSRLNLLPDDLEPYKLLTNKRTEIDIYLKDWRKSIPSAIKQVYFIKKENLKEVLQYLRDMREEVKSLTDDWVESIEMAKERFKEEYPQKYNPANYPSKERIRSGIIYNYYTVDLGVPSAKVVGKEEHKNQVVLAVDRLNRASDIIVEGFVKELYENLTNLNSKKGDARVINSAKKLVELFRENLDPFILDEKIKSVVDNLDKLVGGEDSSEFAKSLRDDNKLSKEVKKITGNIIGELKAIESTPIKRAILY